MSPRHLTQVCFGISGIIELCHAEGPKKKKTLFKGMSKSIQNETRNCMLDIMQGQIMQEPKSAKFMTIQANKKFV